jgi:hypothetical protein
MPAKNEGGNLNNTKFIDVTSEYAFKRHSWDGHIAAPFVGTGMKGCWNQNFSIVRALAAISIFCLAEANVYLLLADSCGKQAYLPVC